MKVEPAELHPAWWWTCDGCGRDNFERAVVYEDAGAVAHPGVTEEDIREMGEGGQWHSHPEVVRCPGCMATRKAYPQGGSS